MRVPRQISTSDSAIAAYTMPKLTPPSVNCKNSVIWPPSRALGRGPARPARFRPAQTVSRPALLEAQVVDAERLVGSEHAGVLGDHHPPDVEHHADVGD